MPRPLAIALQAVIALTALAAFAFMLYEPHLEGRNDGATLTEIYFQDPFLAYAYVASASFFTALFQAYAALHHIRRGAEGTPKALRALRLMKYAAFAMIAFVVIGEIPILLSANEDRPAGVFLGGLIALSAIVVATIAAVGERALQRRLLQA